MEEFPEELRTPPASLVSLVGCPELHGPIAASLQSEQPPIHTLALPDFSRAALIARKPPNDPLSPAPAAAGILKRDWLLKHRSRVPAVVAALFRSSTISGDPSHWLQACSDLEHLKSAINGRGTKLVVVLVQDYVGDQPSEDTVVALRKRAEVESKYLIVLVENDISEFNQSLSRLSSIFAELCFAYYRDEGRKIKARIEKRNFASTELSIRYCFKVAVYSEFRRDWQEALRFYEEGFRVLREMIPSPARLPSIQRLIEIKSVAELLHFKISTLLIHSGKIAEAIAWFDKHIASYERLVGQSEASFCHWEWLSRQSLVFGQLLETRAAAATNTFSSRFGTLDNPLTECEFEPAYYYQLAANYLKEKRISLELSSSKSSDVADIPESVVPSVYVGQYARLYEQGDTVAVLPLSDAEFTSYALAEARRFQDSYEVVALFKKASEMFKNHGFPRIAAACDRGMAMEYYVTADYNNSKQVFEGIATLYRQEGWVTLLWECLGYLRECSRKLGLAKEFVEYSLEMATVPLLPSGELGKFDSQCNFGPGGLPTITRREEIQEEVFRLPRREQVSALDSDINLQLTEEQVMHIDIDLISPLRAVVLASVAFHDQTVRPGSSTMITVSLLSQLPCPFDIDHLEVQFNQPACNFVMRSSHNDLSASKHVVDNQDPNVKIAPSLRLLTNKWLRLTCEIKPEQSGKLECLSVITKVGKFLVICSSAESPASMEELSIWKFEDRVESCPTKDPGLSFSGQKFIQVEEPQAQVDVQLSSRGPALVGELFVVPVTIQSKGHSVHSGELKINLVDARGGGLLMSPREAEQFDSHHVELLSISGVSEDDINRDNADSIKKIQYSFGVISVPVLGVGELWSCKLEIKWHRPKSVMLYVSLGYCLDSTQESLQHRLNVHKSLQIEGKTPLIIDHRMAPFWHEPLLLSKIKNSSTSNQMETISCKEASILIVNAKNCTEVPLRLMSMSITHDDDWNMELCTVHQISGILDKDTLVLPGDEFKGIFSIRPLKDKMKLCIGSVSLKWARDTKLTEDHDNVIVTKHKLSDVFVEDSPLIVTFECPPYAILGNPFTFYVKIHNSTSLLQEIKYSLPDCQNFVFSGAHDARASILPQKEHIVGFKLVPLISGSQALPRITLTSARYSAAFSPTYSASTIFVYPSEPSLVAEQSALVV